MSNEDSFELRQTLSPILFQPIIGVLVTIPFFFAELRHYGLNVSKWDWSFLLLYIFIMSFASISWARSVRRYHVFYRSGEVGMRPTGAKADIVIPVNKIESIKKEFSFETGRVPKRIAIYGNTSDGSFKYVDVSLKHFVREDIHKLMHIIHKQRPDLDIPEIASE